MALQVWLPLNGDLHNQGLQNIDITNNGAVINNNGKIGKCCSFGTTESYLSLSANAMTSFTTECSVSFWLDILSWNTTYATYFQAGTASSSWANYIFGFLRNSSNSNCCFTISDSSANSGASYLTPNLNLNTWYHISLVYKTGHCLIYINGELHQDYTTTIVPKFSGITRIRLGHSNGSGYQSNYLINDFRIYDHALSAEEVAEIAKGLVLHYPLSNSYNESTTNLLNNENLNFSDWTTNQQGTLTTDDNINSIKCIKWTAASASTSSPGLRTKQKISFLANTTYTFSALVQGQGDKQFRIYIPDVTSKPTKDYLIPERISTTFSFAADTSAYIYILMNTCTENSYIKMAQPQLEIKEYPTAYTPTSRENTTIYDISGYSNNGTITGTLETTTPSPKYNCATQFDGSSYILTPSGSFNWYDFSQGTFSAWIKPTATANSWSGTIGIAGNNNQNYKAFGISFFANEFRPVFCDTNYSTITTGKSLPVGEWHFCCATINETTVKIYFDGELIKTTTIDWKTTTIPTNLQFQVGVDRPGTDEKFTGQYSDVRFYATVLTDIQVAQLYKDSKIVDSSGNITPRDLE